MSGQEISEKLYKDHIEQKQKSRERAIKVLNVIFLVIGALTAWKLWEAANWFSNAGYSGLLGCLFLLVSGSIIGFVGMVYYKIVESINEN